MTAGTTTESGPSITLPDRFRLDGEIGRGGMAVVYRAYDRHLDRQVAIKVLSQDLSSMVSAERFQREIALMAKLVHPGVVALFDSGESGGRLYYVMPYVAGDTLRARLARDKRMTADDAASLGADIAEALAYAHGLGIVHRDVKPENIFSVSGRAVLADFGIARLVGTADSPVSDLTGAGMMIGTMSYISPEQSTGDGEIDGRADLYSLGCVLYELLTGAPPFAGNSPMALVAKHHVEAPRPLSDHAAGIPAAMCAIVMQLLAKKREDRPSNAGEVARKLRVSARSTGDTTSVVSNENSSHGGSAKSLSKSEASISEVDRLAARGFDAWRRGVSGAPGSKLTLEESRAYFERALKLDPDHARALCGLGNYHGLMAIRGFADSESSEAIAKDYLFRALAADDMCAEVHAALGVRALYYEDDFFAAARHFARCVELDPGLPEGLRFQSVVFKILGRNDEAVASAQAATRRAPDASSVWNGLGDVLLAAGRNAEAVDALKNAIHVQPGYGPALERLEIALFRIGETDQALATRISRLAISGMAERAEIVMCDAAELGYAEARRRDVQRELALALDEAQRTDPFSFQTTTRTLADRIAIAYSELGEWQKAMDWVEKSFNSRPGCLRRMLTDQPFDRGGLASDPRYARLLRVAGLEELLT
ncbi:MAG TPA: protein kinase [Gemmatimonadaceae bacterium]|nr:protein kinase [Gemmatimonadaceae bacterium]